VSDDFTVSGGGVLRVSTEAMATHAAHLREYASTLHGVRARVVMIDEMLSLARLEELDVPLSAARAEGSLDDARGMLDWACRDAEFLVAGLATAAEGYGLAEHLARQFSQDLAAHLAWGLGATFPFVIGWLVPPVGATIGSWFLSPEDERRRVADWIGSHGHALSDPRVIELVRLAVMSVDEFGAGAVHLPPQLLGVLGPEALGILGLSASAGVLTNAARAVGLATETPVTVSRTGSNVHATAPTGMEDLAKRIPPHAAQVRVERYEVPGGPDRFTVYIGGTRDGSPVATTEPFDMSSNLTAMGMGDAGSVRAVRMAMAEAGITADSPVQFIGYSQGALVGVTLAESGDYNTQGIFTVGGPTGQLEVPPDTPYLALEHTEDIVPALGGHHADADTVVVRRSLFSDAPVPDTSPLPAHELQRYRESASLLDTSNESRVVGIRDSMNAFTADATSVESTTWQAKRMPANG
jgi:predicted esterase